MEKFIKKTIGVVLVLIMIISTMAPAAFAADAPRISVVANTTGGVKVAYIKADGIDEYDIYRKDAENDWTVISRLKGKSAYGYIVDRTAKSGVNYTYALGYVKDGEDSGRLELERSIYYLAVPEFTLAMMGNKVCVEYTPVDGASGYQIIRKEVGGTYTTVGYSSDGSSFVDSSVKLNTTYVYAVRSYTGSNLSYQTEKKIYTYPAPYLTNVQTGVKVSYKKYDGAAKYELYRKTDDGEWIKLREMKPSSWTYFVDTAAESGKINNYKVNVVLADGTDLVREIEGAGICYMAIPKFTLAMMGNKVCVEYTPVNGATGYQILRKEVGGSFVTVGYSKEGTTFVDSGIKLNTTYIYAVRSYSGSNLSYHTEQKIYTYPSPKVANVQTGVKVEYKKYDGAVLYELYRKTDDGEWIKLREMKPSSWSYFVDTAAESGVAYNYKVNVVFEDGTNLVNEIEGSMIRYMKSPDVTVTASDEGAVISIEAVGGAKSYQILKKSTSKPNYTTLCYAKTTEYVDSSVVDGETYTYAIMAWSADGYSSYFIPVTFETEAETE